MPSATPTDLLATWAARFKHTREQQGLTVREVADRAGVTTQYIYLIEDGKNSPSDTLRMRLAAALNVRVCDVWTYPDEVAS